MAKTDFPEVQAVAALSRAESTLSRAERAFLEGGYLNLYRVLPHSGIASVMYEWLTFRLPGGTYTPDFMVIFSDGRLVFVEVKESAYARGYRDSRSKLRAAAALNPWFYFVMAAWKRSSNTWQIDLIPSKGSGFRDGIIIR